MTADIQRLRRQLERLEQVLLDGGFAVAEHLAPGLPRAEIEQVAAEVGLTFPEELIELYRWHNGTVVDNAAPLGHEQLPGGDEMVSLERAAQTYRRWYTGDPLDRYEREWFPWLVPGHAAVTVIDCAGPPDESARVIYYDVEDIEDALGLSAPSVTAAIEQMIALVERGIWAYYPPHGGPLAVGEIDPDLTLFAE